MNTNLLSHKRENHSSPISSGNKAVVVGAGMGGLVSALILANAGVEVTVLETHANCGGKLRQLWPGSLDTVSKENFHNSSSPPDTQGIDSGPTVLTMRWVFEELFESVGENLSSELELSRLDVLARHAWSADEGADQLTLYADAAQNQEAIGKFAGPAELRRFNEFCRSAKDLYTALEGPIIREGSPSAKKLAFALGPRGLAMLAGIGPMRSLWDSLGGYFKDQRLRQLFARYATYCGSSPWSAPATLMLIAQVEMDGVWSLKGGMRSLAKALEKLCVKRGVIFKYQTRCSKIELKGDCVAAVQTDQGERFAADAVIFNGDIQALTSGLLGDTLKSRLPAQEQKTERSLSAVTWSMRCSVHEERFKLDRHNVFFENNYANEFKDIFINKQLPTTPTVYICAQDRGFQNLDPSVELNDAVIKPNEPLFCLINAPATGDTHSLTKQELDACERATFSLIKRCGLHLEVNPTRTIQTLPEDFHQAFPATGGALYGQATHGWMQVFSRSQATTQVRGLFLTGGSVHPGPGVPMAAMSGRLAGAAAMEHLGLIKR